MNQNHQVGSISVLALNYNGMQLLPSVVPAVLAMAHASHVPVEVIVVDNSSTDDSTAWLGAEYPEVSVVERPDDYLFSLNAAAEHCTGSHLLLLNNDVVPEPESLDRLAARFVDRDIFAVAPKLLGWDRVTPNSGRRVAKYVNGFFHHWQEFEPDRAGPTLFPIGAAFLVRRDRFLEVGGFDPLYRPYYYEDVDLGYQAWVRGWRVVYEPESVMYHKSSATLAVYERAESLRAAEVRNNLLVTWKNSDNETLRLNLSRCARRLIGSIARGDREFVRAVAGALARSGEVLRRRRQLNRVRVRSDREIDEIIFANCPLPSTEA